MLMAEPRLTLQLGDIGRDPARFILLSAA